MSNFDIKTLSDNELQELYDSIEAEFSRRNVIATAKDRIDEVSKMYLEAIGALLLFRQNLSSEDNIPDYITPDGAHSAYPKNAVVKYNDKVYKNLIHTNMETPGNSVSWEEIQIL